MWMILIKQQLIFEDDLETIEETEMKLKDLGIKYKKKEGFKSRK